MLAGVLNGVIKAAPVLVMERGKDVKRVTALDGYLNSIQALSLLEVELVALRDQVAVHIYAPSQKASVVRGVVGYEDPEGEYGMLRGDDVALLREAAQTGFFLVEDPTRHANESYYRITLTKEGRALLSVWLDKVEEEMG